MGVGLALLALAAPASASAAEPPVRVEVLSRSQAAVMKGDRVRVRVSARRRGLVRLGGRAATFPRGKRQVVRLTRRRTLRVRRGRGGRSSCACCLAAAACSERPFERAALPASRCTPVTVTAAVATTPKAGRCAVT